MTTMGTRSAIFTSLMELEPRLMYDGAAVATAADVAAESAPTSDAGQKQADGNETPDTATPDAAASAPAGADTGTAGANGADAVTNALLALGAPAATADGTRQVFIIDGRIGDKDSILEAIPEGADVYILARDADGVAAIADILDQYDGLDAVHVMSHGGTGTVVLGATTLDAGNAASHAEALGRWGSALTEAGDILLYGCATGSGDGGQAFLDTIADLTGADVAASDDATGTAGQGGDWDLERSSGVVETDAIEATGFSGLLVTTPENGRHDFSNATTEFLHPGDTDYGGTYATTFVTDDFLNGEWTAEHTPPAGLKGQIVQGLSQLRYTAWTTDGVAATSVGEVILRTSSGNEIDILEITLDGSLSDPIQVVGYRNGVAIPGYSLSVDHVWSVYSKAVLAWENVDELRFSSSRPPDQGVLNMTIGIVSILVGPIPSLSGTLPGTANALVEGEDEALSLAPLTFAHDIPTSTNLSIKVNGGTLSGSSSGNVTVTGSGTDTLTLTGSAADIDAWLNTSTNITYNSGILSGTDALELSFSSIYEDVEIDLGTRTVSVADVEQKARFEALPSSFPGRVDVAKALDFSNANLIDPDSNGTDFRLTLSVASGTLNIGNPYGGVTVTGMGTDTLVVSGRPSSVETWLNQATRVTYTGVAEGTVELTISGYDTVNGDYTIATTEIDVAPANTAPTVTGIPSIVTMTEDTAGVLDLSGLAISDPDSSGTFTIRIDSGLVTIAADSADGVTATRTGLRYLTLSGTIPALTAYLSDPDRISLTPQANVNGTNYGTISVGVDDGDDNIVTSNVQVDITPVDDPSTLTGTLDRVSATEDATTDVSTSGLDLTSLTFADLDAGTHTLILTVEHGVLFFQPWGGLVVDGSNTSRLTITGTASQINSYFLSRSGDFFRYAPEADLTGDGADTLTISVPGAAGGDDVVLRSIAVDIAGVNDAPTLTGLPANFVVTINQLSPLDLSSVTLADIDSPDPDFRLTLWAQMGGFLLAESTGTVTVAGSGTSTLVVTGSVSDITAWLNSGTSIGYQSIPNKTGTTVDMIRFSGNDGDGSTVTFTNKMVNASADPVPMIPAMGNAPASITVTEETLGAVDLTGVTLTDGDTPAASKTLEISVGNGVLTGAAGAGVVVTGGGTRTLTVTGALADLEAWLAAADKIQYLGDVDVAGNGADTLSFKISNGPGTVQTVMDTVAINITNVNDLPNPTGFPTVVTAQENTRGVLDLSGLKLNDPDNTQFRVVLTASGGVLRYSGTLPPGLTVTGNGTATLALNGFPPLLETFLHGGHITYTPPTGATGDAVATINLTINDNGGSGVVDVATATVNIAPPNAAPTLSGLPSAVTAVEDTASAIDLSGVTLADSDSTGAGFTLTLSVDAGTLAAASAGGVTVTGSGTAAVTLTGTVSAIDAFLNNAQAIKYTSAENAYGTAAATLTLTATDGDGATNVALGSTSIDITNVNDPAGADSLPTRVTATEDTKSGLDLSGVVLSAIDPLDASHKLVLSVDTGTLYATGSGGVSVAGSGTGTLTLTGGRDAIQAWLAVNGAVSYQGTENLNGTGAATLTLKADDLDGGGEVTLGTVSVDITAVNDAPTATGFPATVTAVENATGALNLSGLDLNDIDSADNVSVVLSVTHGTLSFTGADPAFTLSGKGTANLTLTGALADLETFLTSGRVTYTPATDALGSGVDSLVLTVNDLDGSGDITGGTATINVIPPNAAPTLSGLPSAVTAVEDTASAIDLSGITLADSDSTGADFTLTLSVDAGTLAAASAGGVTVTGSGTAAVTLTGTVSAIDAFLNNAQAIKYTGAENAYGTAAATLTLTATDGDGATNVALGSTSIDITNVNDPAGADSLPTRVTATEDTKSGLDLSGVVLSAIDPLDASHKLVLSVDTGTLYATGSGGVSVAGSGTGTLTLTGGRDAIQAWLAVNGAVSYQGTENLNGTGAATLTLKADDLDGGGEVTLGTVSVDITAVNDAPTATGFPVTVTAVENATGALSLSGLDLNDIDSADNVSVVLSVTHGTLSFTGADPAFTLSGKGTANLTLTGALADLETFLTSGRVTYTPATDALGTGVDSLVLTVNDLDGSGAITGGTATINVIPPNAAPTLSGLPSTVTAVEDTASAIDLSGVTLADSDSTGAGFTLTLSVDAGTLAAASAGGVTVTGSGTAAVTLTGTVSAIDAFLNNAQAITYTGLANVHGPAEAAIVVTVNDGDGSGSMAMGTINVTIAPVNDAPVLSGLPDRIDAVEDVPVGVDLSAVSILDVDPSDGDFQLIITAGHGTLSANSAGGVTVQGAGTGTLVLSGSMGAVQSWLQNPSIITYQGAPDAAGTGADTLTVKADDMDGSGPLFQGVIAIDIAGVNDAPTIGDLPGTTTAYRGEDTPLGFPNAIVNDVDAGTETFTVTLSSGNGTLSATAGGGVLVTGSGSGVLVLTGTATEINAFLGNSLVSFKAGAGAGGTAAITLMLDDGNGGTASAAMALDVQNRPEPPPAPEPPGPPPAPEPPGPPPAPEPPGPPPAPEAPRPQIPVAPSGPRQAGGGPATPSPFVLRGPDGAGTPIQSSLQGLAPGGGTGQMPSAVLGQLGAVSPLETSDTPVQQALYLQGSASPGQGGFAPPAFHGLGALGATPPAGELGTEGFGGNAPAFNEPPAEGEPEGGGAQPASQTEAALDAAGVVPEVPPQAPAAEGHVGLTRQLAAATGAARTPASVVTQALEALAASLRA